MRTSLFLILLMSLLGFPVFAQTTSQTAKDTTLLGLPGDNLNLYAVLDLFQKSKTIEDFEKSLNTEKTGINNLDLNLDGKVDFIKVVTKQKGDDFTFILQVAVNEKENQDVAVILVSKDKDKKVTMQIVGDEALYGKGYIVEPKTTTKPSVTPNPAYTGTDPVKTSAPSTTTVVVVESTPIVQYVYSPVYVPYVPPYYYGFYPPYFAAVTVMAVSIYHHNTYHYCGAYGYHGNTTVIVNNNNYNNYHNTRNTSNTVNHNNANGNYNNNRSSTGGSASTRPSNGNKPSTQPSNKPSSGNKPSTQPSNKPSTGKSPSAQPSTRPSTGNSPSAQPAARPSTGTSPSAQPSNHSSSGSSGAGRQSASPSSSPSAGSSSMGSSRSRGGGGGGGGGGRRR